MLLFDRKYTKETKDPKVSAKSVLSVFICGVFIFQPIWKKFFYVPITFSLFNILTGFFMTLIASKMGPTTKIHFWNIATKL